jgi:hypothetical protein
MDAERRASPRKPVRMFFNKYIDRQPHLGEILELSAAGLLARTVHQPEAPRACYAVELALPGDGEPMWLCARRVWAAGELEALAFVAPSDADRRRIDALLAPYAPLNEGGATPAH